MADTFMSLPCCQGGAEQYHTLHRKEKKDNVSTLLACTQAVLLGSTVAGQQFMINSPLHNTFHLSIPFSPNSTSGSSVHSKVFMCILHSCHSPPHQLLPPSHAPPICPSFTCLPTSPSLPSPCWPLCYLALVHPCSASWWLGCNRAGHGSPLPSAVAPAAATCTCRQRGREERWEEVEEKKAGGRIGDGRKRGGREAEKEGKVCFLSNTSLMPPTSSTHSHKFQTDGSLFEGVQAVVVQSAELGVVCQQVDSIGQGVLWLQLKRAL